MSKVDSRHVELLAMELFKTLTGSPFGYGNDQNVTNILRNLARAQLEKENT